MADKPMTEEKFSTELIKVARRHGWLVFRQQRMKIGGFWRSGMHPRGWPDIVLIRPPQFVALELKRDRKSKPSADQVNVVGKLQRCTSVEAYIVRPEDWDEIRFLLEAPAPGANVCEVPRGEGSSDHDINIG